ncbi:MAG TPA: PQQ-dependent sugar dehydrogenase [Candidatus Limnocylindria bacterium]|nr:PQQ-dependent sugar dehydrogenase [Candidatus Limnocylindria bacterium]
MLHRAPKSALGFHPAWWLRTTVGSLGLAVFLASPAASAPDVPSNFVVESAVPGTTFDTPVAMAFFRSGRMLVGEKGGVVWVIHNGVKHPTPLWNGSNEVLNEGDRGLLGVAIDPNYPVNRYVYFLFTVDSDSNGVDTNDDAFGRLVRYQISAADSNVLTPGSRAVLFGRTWAEGPASGSVTHTIGSLRWGRDGSLLVSAGEGAQFNSVDEGGQDPNMFLPGRTNPNEDIGAFRAQDITSLAGKILRLDPANGHGYPSNPYYDGNAQSVRSRVFGYGLRNPFRFNVKPGTGSTNPTAGSPGTLYIGDVGWDSYEELNVLKVPGTNFGWPCYEGLDADPQYNAASPAHHGCSTIGTPTNPATHTQPISAWYHNNPDRSIPPGFEGNAAVGGSFYSGTSYPLQYRDRCFIADYAKDWIKIAVTDANDQLVQILPFATAADGPVDIAPHPINKDLYYVAITANQVRRIRYTGASGGNQPPVADAMGAPTSGAVPLTVNFSSAGSSDPDQDPLGTTWVFGDGNGSFAASPTHVYSAGGVYEAILTVDDGHGATDSDTVVVTASATSGFPTTAVLDNFNRANGGIGPNWVDPAYGLSGVSINNNALQHTCCYQAPVWSPTSFGPDQEAYITITNLMPNAPGHDLMLKVQGNSWNNAHVEVRYDDDFNRVGIHTFTPATGWSQAGAYIPVTFVSGNQLGARAYANGMVEVFKNGVLIGSVSLGSWQWAAVGGRIGLTLDGSVGARFDNFGGGNVVFTVNTPPTATLQSPPANAFYATGEAVALIGTGSDAEQLPATLTYNWVGNLHHNSHVHPSTFVASGANTWFIPQNHDDGTGVWFEIELRVSDNGGLADTSEVFIYPEINLQPSAVTIQPALPGTTAPAQYNFRIRNHGRMPAPISRWRLVAGTTLLSEGDVIVPGRDSVLVSVTVPPVLAVGFHTLRVTADSLSAVFETVESDNGRVQTIEVVEGTGTTDVPLMPARLALSNAFPNPSRGPVALSLELPGTAQVTLSVHDIQGREVWSRPAESYAPGRWLLAWPGQDHDGGRMPNGLYLARVRADGPGLGGVLLVRRIAIVR